ncbi:MAG TPA: FkbM family methyltransferase [Gemmatimonadaceae bacterium]|nr:FkbM family methyltransferase [Gemmatimonadaceae bacterium]
MSTRAEFRRGVRFGVGAAVEHLGMMKSIDIATLVDVGANVGQFTLLTVALHPNVKVEAFEPLSAPAAVFRRLFNGNKRINLHQVALGATETTAEMNVARREDSSSLLPITAQQTESFPGTDKVGVENITVVTLSSAVSASAIRSPALLKLDVQGYELEALRGCAEMLPLFKYVYAELSFMEFYEGQAMAHEVIDFLARQGFPIEGIYNTQYDANGKSIQCDCLFKRSL